MNPRLIPKIARWSAIGAVAIALVAGGIFVYRERLASRAMRQAPPAVPPSVQQRSLEFTFSKVDGQQTVFTIHAAKATQYSGSQSLLEDVDIVVHGGKGERHDEIHTRSCGYEATGGTIVCHGTVDLDLSSVPVSGPGVPTGAIHVEARDVSFNRDTGTAKTDAPVTFRFPQGEGSAVGASYSSRGSDFILRRDVTITLPADRPGGEATVVTAKGGLTYNRDRHLLTLAGPVGIQQGGRRADMGELTVALEGLRPQTAVADGKTTIRVVQGAGRGSLVANRAKIFFDPQGRAERFQAEGQVVATEQAPGTTRLDAQEMNVTLDPAAQQPRMIDATGDVRLEANRGAGVARLSSDSLLLTTVPIAGEAGAVRLDEATVPGESNAEWSSKKSKLRMKSGRMAVAFGADNEIRALHGTGGVQLERQANGKAPLVTTAQALVVNFDRGKWTDAEESGDVRATQGQRNGRADRARWVRAANEIELAGSARVSDPDGQTLADTIEWNQENGKLRASGHVRSSYVAGGHAGVGVAPGAGPVNALATTLEVDSASGETVFSGAARLWQGQLVVQADRIELQRAQGVMTAQGNVMAAFPQAPRQASADGKGTSAGRGNDALVLWRVSAGQLRYTPQRGGEVTLGGGVEAWSSQGRIKAKSLVLRLRRDATGSAELAQATGNGGVTVRQGDRWGEAERAVYDAATGKFVLSGGRPSLRDASGDVVTGDRLTFSVADDTILIESSEGSRTLTRHPVSN